MKAVLYGGGGGGGGGRKGNNPGFGGGAGACILVDVSLNIVGGGGNRINFFDYTVGGGGKGGINTSPGFGVDGGQTKIQLFESNTNNITCFVLANGGGGGFTDYNSSNDPNNFKVGGPGGNGSVSNSSPANVKITTINVTPGDSGKDNATTSNPWGGSGGGVLPGNNAIYLLDANRQDPGISGATNNNFCGFPGTDGSNTDIRTFYNSNSPNGVATYYFYDKSVVITPNTINNTARIGYAGGGGGGGSCNDNAGSVGGPGAPGFIKIWLYA